MNIRSLIISIIIAIGLIVICAPPAFAFGPAAPAEIVDQYTVPDYGTDGHMFRDPAIAYRGLTPTGDYVVVVAWTYSGTNSLIRTYRISDNGSVIGVIDTMHTGYSFARENHLMHYTGNWCVLGNHTPDLLSFQVTASGGIDEIEDTISTGNYITDFSLLPNGVLLALATNGMESNIYSYHLNAGEISMVDSWQIDPTLANARDITWLEGWQSGNQRAIAISAEDDYWGIATVSMSDRQISAAWSGTWAWTYIGDGAQDWGDSCYLSGNRYISVWNVSAVKGHSGNRDVGIEMFKVNDNLSIVNAGTGYLYDEANNSNSGVKLVPVNESVVAMFYDSATGTDLRILYNATGDTIDQSMISAGTTVASQYTTQSSICRLGTSNLCAICYTDSSDVVHIDVVELRYPPVVTTDSLVELGHDQGDAPPILRAYGTIQSTGSSDVTEAGFCYNDTGYPTTSGSRVIFAGTIAGTGHTYSGTITDDLRFDQPYYVRAYACNRSGTGYGDQLRAFTHPLYDTVILDLEFEPLQINSDTIFDQSGYGHDVIYHLHIGTISITVADVEAADPPEVSCTGTDCLSFFRPTLRPSDTWILSPDDRDFETFPGMAFINEIIEGIIPIRLFWITGGTMIMVAAGLYAFQVSRLLLLTGVIAGIAVFLMCALHWLGWWVFAINCFFIAGMAIKSETREPF